MIHVRVESHLQILGRYAILIHLISELDQIITRISVRNLHQLLLWRSLELSESTISCSTNRIMTKLFFITENSTCLVNSCVQSGKKIDNIGSKMSLPPGWSEMVTHDPKVPPLFIINFQIPSEFPTSFFTEITDGPGWSLVLYFRMSQVRKKTSHRTVFER